MAPAKKVETVSSAVVSRAGNLKAPHPSAALAWAVSSSSSPYAAIADAEIALVHALSVCCSCPCASYCRSECSFTPAS